MIMPTNDQQLAQDHNLKRAVVWTICLVTLAGAGTVYLLSYQGATIPDALDRLVTFVVGGLMGMLAKTGVDKALNSEAPLPVTTPPGEPLETREVSRTEEEI
jgi:hypothetical protein